MNAAPLDRRPALRPPQFGLSTLLWVVAFVCAVLAAMNTVGPIGAFALVIFILCVLAHVSGNALGMRLRSCGDQPVDEQDRPVNRAREYQRGVAGSPPPRLGERRRLGLVLTVIVALSVSLGAVGGAWWTATSQQPPPTAQDIALGAAAFGVLGGIWGLIGGGFLVVGAGAVKEALQGAKPSKPPE